MFLLCPTDPDCLRLSLFASCKISPARSAFDFFTETICWIQQRVSSFAFFLYLFVCLSVYNRFVRVRNIVLRQFSIIPDLFLRDRISHIGFLSPHITDIHFIVNDSGKSRFLKWISIYRPMTGIVQISAYFTERQPIKIHLKYPSDNFCFIRYDNVLFLFFIVPIAENMLIGNTNLTGLESLANSPFTVL